jgi:meso-butanediol dehydrogenase / (S,S)-butanediol dehydrogenase / diacetyl reductase
MYKDLSGKRVIITGGSSGIGFATAKRFVDEGARVVIFGRNQEKLDKAQAMIPDLAGYLSVDVGREDQVAGAFQKTDEIMGGIDILISNAGISYRNGFLDITYDQWKEVMRINLDGMFLCAQEAISRMKEQKSGVVLLTASTNGFYGYPFYADYNASKAGVIMLAKTLALEFAPWLRANAVCPGYTLTPMQKAEYTREMLDHVNSTIPLNRHAEPEELAGFFAYLASHEGRYFTGQAISMDGGESMGNMIEVSRH